MSAIIFILICVLSAAALAVYRVRRLQSDVRPDGALEPPPSGGLFDDPEKDMALKLMEAEKGESNRRRDIRERAARGDKDALSAAHETGDSSFYSEILDALIEASPGQEEFQSLVTHVAESNRLKANKGLVERICEQWKSSPGKRATVEMLHIAALADDAAAYQSVIEMVIKYVRSGQLLRLSAAELSELIESQYWLLAPEVRSSGAGFRLKQRIAEIRRELATATPAN